MTPDPIGLAGGINLIVYVGNNSVNYIDPFGLLGIFGPGFTNIRWPSQNPYSPGPDTEYEAPAWMQALNPSHGKSIPGQFGTVGLIPVGLGLVDVIEKVEPAVTNMAEVLKGGPVILLPYTKEEIEKMINDLISPRSAGASEKEKKRGCGR